MDGSARARRRRRSTKRGSHRSDRLTNAFVIFGLCLHLMTLSHVLLLDEPGRAGRAAFVA